MSTDLLYRIPKMFSRKIRTTFVSRNCLRFTVNNGQVFTRDVLVYLQMIRKRTNTQWRPFFEMAVIDGTEIIWLARGRAKLSY